MKTLALSLFVGASSLFSSSLVVYNSNIGLVHEERPLRLDKNAHSIIYKDVASSIITESINLKLPKGVQLYSQQYRYDKLTLAKLLEYNIGKKVKVGKDSFTLLAANNKEAILKNKKGNIVTRESKAIIFDKIPNRLLSKPSLLWNVKTDKNINAKLELDYLIKNIKWSANYVLDIVKNRANLRGFITLTNNSGKSFKDTTLYTLAGTINRVRNPQPRIMYSKMMAQNRPIVQESAHEGYHIYKIPFKVTLANKEKTQINFQNFQNIKVQREYEAQMSNPLFFHGESNINVNQYITLQKLDTPLPSGIVRIYSKLHDTAILLGESSIKHTPKNEALKLKIGVNFDIKVKQSILKRSDSNNYYSADIRYTLSNHSDEEKRVALLIPFNKNRDARIKSAQKYVDTKGNLATFSIKIKANTSKSFDVHFESRK
ncbi:hypothetical protein [Sulfurimonas sp.]|uniref:DUF4139 domain-containing protein n=1 Tax=Sulfurimonas sp. TaxID=2022749 RepID=UPI002603F171|nr:hypothetical protein [Sulfurimonas sp.]